MRRLFLSLILAIALLASWNSPSFAGFFFPGITSENFWGQLYDPTTMATPTQWFKSTNVVLDTTLGQPTVSSWTNLGSAGSALTAVQATKVKQPIYMTGQAGGYPAVVFDSFQSIMGISSSADICKAATSCTFIIVGDFTIDKFQFIYHINTGTSSGYRHNPYFNNSPMGQLGVAAKALDGDTISTGVETTPYQASGLRVYMFQVDYTNRQAALWSNGTNELAPSTLTSMTAGPTSNTNAIFTLGGYGPMTSGNGNLKGKIYEIMLFEDKVLTAYERSHIQNYLRYKYGVSW